MDVDNWNPEETMDDTVWPLAQHPPGKLTPLWLHPACNVNQTLPWEDKLDFTCEYVPAVTPFLPVYTSGDFFLTIGNALTWKEDQAQKFLLHWVMDI